MKKVILAIVLVMAFIYLISAESSYERFIKKIPNQSNYTEFVAKPNWISFLPVGASYFSPINGVAQYGFKKVEGGVLVRQWRFSKNTSIGCVKNSYIPSYILNGLYDYQKVCS